ncbi:MULTISPECIES: ABC transporter ATP-binding protein [unclassified Bradyrhizobium]|uniref:ABC transporter ATP-binding protein n=1 Tax=unclassified Bradyrhizobium TaxID=2631580 RepID=UPI00211E36E7|nr:MULTISPECIES: oligopeptide/dipeptide ABC transporter ATP-binding protein [unclassified Bradyrhizobium]MDD1533194.1 peptide ABC transporter substrate-binding protein [Bradyrhizobium sp. WBOS8]MDD1582848.1 peptide ABC transporter substrate-binding protein [Bradyrhizobium sp. WBOS4]UUO48297.1 peptide ABC transporter substrate-binding protein [Bradyrhizobium sp. WBOS04]UUO61918.1 peptide ABC transporter substrate-binding protein [Bradyrhizobium sp. WBOS08]
MSPPLLQVNDLKKHFPVKAGLFSRKSEFVYAVDGVSFEIARGETLSLVGESGCGKSTVGRAILRLFDITAGQVILDGQRIDDAAPSTMRQMRRRVQVVFQDPFSSLNPRMRVRDILAEPIRNFGLAKSAEELEVRLTALMDTVRLPREALNRRPHEFSGGQRQRIGIARALAAEPELIVCDEAVSALDVSVKAQIVNLLQDLQSEFGLALLFISHDLAIVEHMTHRVAVMYLGKIVEVAPRREIFAAPRHPYTKALLSAVPLPEPGAQRNPIILKGDVPSPINPPKGCRFHTRCPLVFDRCRAEEPVLRAAGTEQWVACHLEEAAPEASPEG